MKKSDLIYFRRCWIDFFSEARSKYNNNPSTPSFVESLDSVNDIINSWVENFSKENEEK